MNTEIINSIEDLVEKENRVLSYKKNILDELSQIAAERCKAREMDSRELALKIQNIENLIFEKNTKGDYKKKIEKIVKFIKAKHPQIYSLYNTNSKKRIKKVAKLFSKKTLKLSEERFSGVLSLQKKLGQGLHEELNSKRYSPHLELNHLSEYLKAVTSAPSSKIETYFKKSYWHLQIIKWRFLGYFKNNEKSLSIGPRWLTEIFYFRDIVGLKRHIGLDLFTDDKEIVVQGDMHRTKFKSNTFGFIFLKNVVDKSYNCRLLVKELTRICRPGGIIVVDQICGYGSCTQLTRTDIQKCENLLTLFKAICHVKALVVDNIDISGIGDAEKGNEKRFNARLAVQINK